MSTHLLLNEKPLMVLPSLAKLIGINASIAVQQIHWFIEIKEDHDDDRTLYNGFLWCKYSLKQWQDKLQWMSIDGISRMFTRLEAQNFIVVCQPDSHKRDQTKWYRINYEGLESFTEAQNANPKSSKKRFRDRPQVEIRDRPQVEIRDRPQVEIRDRPQVEMINIKEIKEIKKETISCDFFENTPLESKTNNLSVLSKPKTENLEKTPPLPPLTAARNYAQEMSDRFSHDFNRFAPRGLSQQGFLEWHLGSKRNDWHVDLIAVAKAHLKKHERPSGDGDAINFINNICKIEDWAKFELLADQAKLRQQDQSQARSQQEVAPPEIGREVTPISTMPTAAAREFAARLARKIS